MSLISADNNISGDNLHVSTYDDFVVSVNQSNEDNEGNSFNDLQMLINNSVDDEINLKKDYTYDNYTDSIFTEGILINKSIVINGNGHIIDAQNQSRIFNITADNVIIRNITFINANCIPLYENGRIIIKPIIFTPTTHSHEVYNAVVYKLGDFYDESYTGSNFSFKGGAIYCSGNNLKIVNSSFINNNAQSGGAIYIEGCNSQLIDLLFINNTAYAGGTIFNHGRNTFISHSRFNLMNTQYWQYCICSNNDINIQDCNFTNESKGVIFYGGNWSFDNMNSTYFNSFVKFGQIIFKFNLTYLYDDYYNLKIVFGLSPVCNPKYDFQEDHYGYSVNKTFYLNIDDNVYKLHTDSNSQVNLSLNLSIGMHCLKIYNPITNLSISDIVNVSKPLTDNNKIKKSTIIIIAKNKVFNKKTKIKKYSMILKNNYGKIMKNTWVTLKIKGKVFKSKTDKNGKALFKIKKLNKKGKHKANIIFNGDNTYNKVIKKINIIVK